jgi:hypothetical protein
MTRTGLFGSPNPFFRKTAISLISARQREIRTGKSPTEGNGRTFFVARQKPSFSRHISDNLRHLSHRRGKNSGKTSEKSIKNGGKWRFFEAQSAISTSVYTTGTVAQTTGMLTLTSAGLAACSGLLAANLKTERHFFGCDSDRCGFDRRDMTVAPGSSARRRLGLTRFMERFHRGAIDLADSTWYTEMLFVVFVFPISNMRRFSDFVSATVRKAEVFRSVTCSPVKN